MKKFLVSVLLISTVLLMTSCATTMCEPKKSDDTLLLGRISMKVSGLKSAAGSVLNGDKHGNMEVIIQNITTGEKQILLTDKNGLFMTKKINPDDSYKIVNFSFNKDFSVGRFALIDVPLDFQPGVLIQSGNLNVFCDISITCIGQDDGSIKWSWKNYQADYYNVRQIFYENYSKSKWVNYPYN